MLFQRLLVLSTLLTGACGINLKAPSDLGVKVNLDAKGLTENVRSLLNKKIPPEYLRFLKDDTLKHYILNQAYRFEARCLVPTKQMADFEGHEASVVFSLNQRCYYEDQKEHVTKEIRFEIMGSIDLKTLSYRFEFEAAPEFAINDISDSDYAKISVRHTYLTE